MKLRILFLFCLIFTCIFAADYIYKHPQGPPTEFAAFKAPLPQETATHSGAAIIDIDLNENGNQNIEIPVDANEEFSISILSPIYQHLDIKILQPNSQLMSIKSLAKDITEDFGIDGARFPSHSFQFANPVKGVWQVMINCNDLKALQQLKSKLRTSNVPQGKIISSNYSPYKIEAHLASLETVKDGKVGFELRLVDSSKPKTSYLHDPIVGANIKAELEVDEPNGKEITVEMNDNGLFGDRVANDGIYYAQFNADQVGRYIAQMIVTGTDPEGKPLLRTTEITFNAVSDNIDITGAFANYDEQNQVFNIYLNLKTETLLKDSQPYRYKVWSEVWGKTSNGQYVSVGWVNGFTELEKATNGQIVLGRVELNHRWLVLAKVVSDLQLRNLRVSDADWSVIIDNIASLDVQASIPKLRLSQRDPPLDVITDSMKYGYETENYKNKFSKSAALNFKVLLIHGYCAKTQPFPAAEFTNAVEFTGGLSLSLSNDEFSRRIISFLMAQQINSSSFIAHSQGGMVSVHTLNYYVTPLDQAVQTQQRIIQTVGTPYQGSNLAGSVAGLGEIFGIGCGSNNDLSLNGAQSWLSGISPDSRKYSNYYYTQYQTGNLINYCNLAANSVLKWPNDGTTEVIYADLQGGQSQGKAVVGWCHTTDMRSTAQYLDSSRNRAMNTYANSASK